VTWNVAACAYFPKERAAQTFTVSGTAMLPAGVVNTNSVPLTVVIDVTVRAASSDGRASEGTPPGGGSSKSGGGGCDAGLGSLGLLIALSSIIQPKRK
jgi:hypothetical protein